VNLLIKLRGYLPVLPFLKRKQDAALGEPLDHLTRKADDASDEDLDGLEVAAHDALDAIKRSDAKALAEALKAAFELCDAEPHEEGEHIDE
jgi:hypothetical protein